jgi:hypothetical protein
METMEAMKARMESPLDGLKGDSHGRNGITLHNYVVDVATTEGCVASLDLMEVQCVLQHLTNEWKLPPKDFIPKVQSWLSSKGLEVSFSQAWEFVFYCNAIWQDVKKKLDDTLRSLSSTESTLFS